MNTRWCQFPVLASRWLLLLPLVALWGCGYTLKDALRDTNSEQRAKQQQAVDYLSAYIAQRTNSKSEGQRRLKAVQALGRVPARKSINTLRLVLMHESDAVLKREAIRSLGQLRAREALTEVREALAKDDDLDVRMAAAATLGRLGDRRAQKDLIRALRDPQPAVRTAAVRSLVALRAAIAVPRMVDALVDNHVDVRVAASNGLVKIKNEALPYLIKELRFLNAKRRKRVATVLGRFGRMAWVPLFQAFAEPKSRAGAKLALKDATRDPRSWDALEKILDQPVNDEGKNQLKTLQSVGSLATVQAIFTLWDHIVVGYRLLLPPVLGKITWRIGDEARKILVQAAKQGDDLSYRTTALFALGHSGEEAISRLQPFLLQSNRVLVIATLRALGWTGSKGLPVLKLYITHNDEELRLNAVRALGNINTPEAVELLFKTLSDKAATLRIAALKGLAKQGDKRAIPQVRAMLNDPLNDVALTAIQTLLKLGDEKNLKLYIQAIRRSPYPPAPTYVKTLGELGDQQVIPLLQRLIRTYVRHWKAYRREARRKYRRYKSKRRNASDDALLGAVQQDLKEHIAAQPNAICTLIEAVRALTRLNQPAFVTLQKAGYRSTSRFNPLQSPPERCPWPSLSPSR